VLYSLAKAPGSQSVFVYKHPAYSAPLREKSGSFLSQGAQGSLELFCLLFINNKNILCALCALARDPVDSVNLAIIV
jgi:hypothetical protein